MHLRLMERLPETFLVLGCYIFSGIRARTHVVLRQELLLHIALHSRTFCVSTYIAMMSVAQMLYIILH